MQTNATKKAQTTFTNLDSPEKIPIQENRAGKKPAGFLTTTDAKGRKRGKTTFINRD
jgi:hypothetical protein